ncbi:nuclear transport factor 2 family protein [Ramlibacter sp.]|uniref:YybH family protein n=1 Tax=Ramlibacter sp. TaxID=1917967 RepID=UPI0025FB3F5A|nr:nuclear transport factor 2 family protein [Ramlibacter sp.]
MDLIDTPVTGNEPHGDTRDAGQALSLFYAALNAKDMAGMQRCWSAADDCSMDNPLGGIARGWSDIQAVYARLFGSAASYRFSFHDYSFHAFSDTFLVVGRERGWFEKDGQRLELAFRTSRLFRLEAGAWHQFHHHGSAEDARMLAAYQALVLGKA